MMLASRAVPATSFMQRPAKLVQSVVQLPLLRHGLPPARAVRCAATVRLIVAAAAQQVRDTSLLVVSVGVHLQSS